MINWVGIKALLVLAGAIIFSKEFYVYTNFLIQLHKSGNRLRTKKGIITKSTFFAMWCLSLLVLLDMWLPWLKVIIGLVYDYRK